MVQLMVKNTNFNMLNDPFKDLRLIFNICVCGGGDGLTLDD